MPETPIRHVRMPDDIWAALKARAEAEHTTVTALILRAVLAYL